MMADSNVKNNTRHGGVGSGQEDVDGPGVLGCTDMSEENGRQTGHLLNRLHSPTIQESGYNTDVSPATTSSSHGGTPSQHFDFDDLSEVERSDSSRQRPTLTISVTSTGDDEASTVRPSYGTDTPSLSSSDNTGRYSFSDGTRRSSSSGSTRNYPDKASEDTSTNWLGFSAGSRSFQDLRVHGVPSDDEEEGTDKSDRDDEMTSSEERYRESQISHTKRCSLRRRNFDLDADFELEALGDFGKSKSWPLPVPDFGFRRQESRDCDSHSDPNSPVASSVSNCLRHFLEQDITANSIGIADNQAECETGDEGEEENCVADTIDDLLGTHEFEPQLFRMSLGSDEEDDEEAAKRKAPFDDNDDDDVFTFDLDDARESAHSSHGLTVASQSLSYLSSSSSPVTQSSLPSLRHSANSTPNIVSDKPPISPSSLSSSAGRRRRPLSAGVSVKLQLSGGACISHNLEMSRSFTVGTQTPHVTSSLIQDVLSSPVALPNEARGPAVSRLRRLSENGAQLPPSPAPLPDIVPFHRDRSSSAPDIQCVARRQAIRTGRLVGRELRRMSDEFNTNRFQSFSSNGDLREQASSFPGVRPLLSLVRGAFRSRTGSSVDDDTDPNEGS